MTDDYEGVLAARFSGFGAAQKPASAGAKPAQHVFGSVDRSERKARERKSTRTPAQRAHRAKRTNLINFKTTDETKELLQQLATEMKLTKTAVIELGLQLVAAQHAKGGKGKP